MSHEEHSSSERWRLLVLLLGGGLALVLVSELYLFPWIKTFASTAHCRQVLGIPGTTALWFGVFVGVPASAAILSALLLLPSALRAIRTRRFPPPGTKVLRRTRIVTGWPAALRGYAACAMVLLLVGVAGWGYLQVDRMKRAYGEPQSDANPCSLTSEANAALARRAGPDQRTTDSARYGKAACAIPGEPVQWIADYCMASLGTDDEIAASDCIGEQLAEAPKDACAAKVHFKQGLCRIVVANGSRPGSVEACVGDPGFSGNTVSQGGVGGGANSNPVIPPAD